MNLRLYERISAVLGLLVVVSLTGCGYALVGRASNNVPEDVREVYVRPLENKTQRTQVEQALTRAIADEMVTRNRFSVVGAPEGADAELSGTVVGFDVRAVTFDASGRATQYEIVVVAQMAFKRVGSDDVIWSNDRYVFRQSYEIQATETAYFDREDEAIEEAAQKFAETMVSDLLEGF